MADDMFKRIGRIAKDKASDVRMPTSNPLGGAVGGAVVGGMLLGPFGAIFGSQIGSNMASRKAATEQLERMGLSRDMIKGAQELMEELQTMEKGAQEVRDAYQNQAQRALQLEQDAEKFYEKAKAAVEAGDDDTAREMLEKRKRAQADLEKQIEQVKLARSRRDQMDGAVEAMARRANEYEQLMKRSMDASAVANAIEQGDDDSIKMWLEGNPAEPPPDSLEAKFRALEDEAAEKKYGKGRSSEDI